MEIFEMATFLVNETNIIALLISPMEERRGAYIVWVGNPERNIPLGRPRHRWEDNIKMDLK
jgi:hypothetical protein